MRSGYRQAREWSDFFIPEMKLKIAPYLMAEASFELDTRYATDLIVLRATMRDREIHIAARMRNAWYAKSFPDDFTIRSRLDNGFPTEIHKIKAGFGDWFFYGFASGRATIGRWFLIDLEVFRKYHHLADLGEKPNGDGTFFRAYRVTRFPSSPPLLIASSDNEKAASCPLTIRPMATNTDRIQLDLFAGSGTVKSGPMV